MSSQHKHKGRYLRGVTDEEWADFDAAVKQAAKDRSAVAAAFIRWYIRQPEAELPERPEPPASPPPSR